MGTFPFDILQVAALLPLTIRPKRRMAFTRIVRFAAISAVRCSYAQARMSTGAIFAE